MLLHIIDTERVMAYRALVAAHGDATSPLPSVDENLYAANADVSSRSLENILEEFKAVREKQFEIFETVSEEANKFYCRWTGFSKSNCLYFYWVILCII